MDDRFKPLVAAGLIFIVAPLVFDVWQDGLLDARAWLKRPGLSELQDRNNALRKDIHTAKLSYDSLYAEYETLNRQLAELSSPASTAGHSLDKQVLAHLPRLRALHDERKALVRAMASEAGTHAAAYRHAYVHLFGECLHGELLFAEAAKGSPTTWAWCLENGQLNYYQLERSIQAELPFIAKNARITQKQQNRIRLVLSAENGSMRELSLFADGDVEWH